MSSIASYIQHIQEENDGRKWIKTDREEKVIWLNKIFLNSFYERNSYLSIRQTNKIFARKSRLLKKQKKVELEERILLLKIENEQLKQVLFEQDILLKELNIVLTDDLSTSGQTCSSCSRAMSLVSSESSSDFDSDCCIQSDGEDNNKPLHFNQLDLDLAEFLGFDF